MFEDVVVGCEDAVGKPVVAHELPYVLGRVELRAFWRQLDDGDVWGNTKFVCSMPAGLIHQQHTMGIGRYGLGYFGQMERHGFCNADREDQAGVFGSRRTRAASGPATGDLVFLADAGLVLEPDLYRLSVGERGFDFRQIGSKAPFLKASIASSFWV